MKQLFQVIIIGVIFSVFFTLATNPRKAHAATGSYGRTYKEQQSRARSMTARLLEKSSLRQIRLIRSKMDIESIKKLLERKRSKCADEEHDGDDDPNPPTESPTQIQARAVVDALFETQKKSPIGLIESFSQDPNLVHQAFTYDQALAGIVFLKQGQTEPAKKIFDFYNSQWSGTAFFTNYNTEDVNGARVETAQTLGATSWIGLFSLHYYKMTGDVTALELATKIGLWAAQQVPHYDGGLAMGDTDSGIWSGIFSTENNLSYYALANGLSKHVTSPSHKTLFESEKSGIEHWLQVWAYDPSEGLFERGRGDENNAFDTNSWAINVLGIEKLNTLFGIDTDPNNSIASNLIRNVENSFAVQQDGAFGGDLLTAKGFDFSDGFNAQTIGRQGFKWVEGTQHMILAYRQLAAYWSGKNNTISEYYLSRAKHFLERNAQNAITQDNKTSYEYTDATSGTLIFYDIHTWRTAGGPGVASSAWVYLSLKEVNPFDL